MPEFIDNRRRNRVLASRVYWIVTAVLIIVAEVLAIRAAVTSRAPRNWIAPSVFLLPFLVLLPAAVSFRLYRRFVPQVATSGPTGAQAYSLGQAFLQLIMFEYVAVVWALAVLDSVLVR